MRTLCYVLTLVFLAGCAGQDYRPDDRKSRKSPAALSDVEQYKAARGAFQEKLAAAQGLTLAELKAQWGQVRQGPTHNQSTAYHWVQTITVTIPPEAAAEPGLNIPAQTAEQALDQTRSLPCMAVFIVNQKGVVEEAFSEGPCLDHTLMPGWKPVIKSAGHRPDVRG